MIRSLAIVVLGVVIGAAVVFVYFRDVPDSSIDGGDTRDRLDPIAGSVIAEDRRSAAAVSVAETLEAYRATLAETDLQSLGNALSRVAQLPRDAATEVETDALLARLGDLDPAFAADLAVRLDLGSFHLTNAYLHWADVDLDSAVAALGEIASPARRLDVALALQQAFGQDPASRDIVARGLSASDSELLRARSIVARAEAEPLAALRDALALRQSDLGSLALSDIGAVWASQDPRGALAQAALLPQELAASFRAGVFSEWARLDGADFVAWIASTPAPPTDVEFGIDLLGSANLRQLIDTIEPLSGDEAASIRESAYRALAESDPPAAMERAAADVPGVHRDRILMAVATAVARRDADAAYEWAREVDSPPTNFMNQIAVSMVSADPRRAVSFLQDPPDGVDPQLVVSVLGSSVARDPELAESVATSLAASEGIRAASALARVVGSWARHDPTAARAWLAGFEERDFFDMAMQQIESATAEAE